jgi:hypothetical protein
MYVNFFLNKTLKCDQKGELGHIHSGVCDLPCDDPSLVTSRISGNSLYINAIILSQIGLLSQVTFITMENVKWKNGNRFRYDRISSYSCYNLKNAAGFQIWSAVSRNFMFSPKYMEIFVN